MSCNQNQGLMDAYLDGELDLVGALEIEQHLKECPNCSKSYEKRRSFIAALKSSPLSYKAPADLVQSIHSALRKNPETAMEPSPLKMPWLGTRKIFSYPLAAALAMAASFLFVIRFIPPSGEERLGQEVVSAHVRSLMANHLVDVETSNQHVVKPWFNGRLDFSPTVRELSDHGFPLVGGRLDYLNGRPVASIIYYRAKHPINLFIWPSKQDRAEKEKVFTRQGYHLIRWAENGMTYWAISDVNEHELKDFADLFQ